MKRYFLLIFIVLFIVSCSLIKHNSPSLIVRPTSTSSLKFLALKSGIEIGAAVALQPLREDETYREVLAREFNTLIPENAMKFDAIHPERYQYKFKGADEIVDFAEKNNMKVFGHTLLWHIALPKWLKEGDFTRNELMGILRDHIYTVVGRYKGKIVAWDAVNEAIARDGSLLDSIWLRKIGPEYLDLVFQWAHEADPNARLFFNEFSAEGLSSKSDGLYAIVSSMVQRGIPITGIGLQMHKSLGNPPNVQQVAKNIKRFADLGLEVQITEMDVKTGDGKGSLSQKMDQQAKMYGDILHICLSFSNCKTFMLWGFTDRYSWINSITGTQDGPLIFDISYQPKKSYDALASVLNNSK